MGMQAAQLNMFSSSKTVRPSSRQNGGMSSAPPDMSGKVFQGACKRSAVKTQQEVGGTGRVDLDLNPTCTRLKSCGRPIH